MTGTAIRLLVVDDHTLFRRGLVALLSCDAGLRVVGEAGDAAEAVHSAAVLQPDVILLDQHLPGATGIQALPDLRDAAPGARIVLLTMSEDPLDLHAALRGGADGYLLKTIDGELLIGAIGRVMHGEPVVSPQLLPELARARRAAAPQPAAARASASPNEATAAAPPPGWAQLSAREQDVLRLIARGESNKEIGRALDIAETTVKIHVQHILRKLGLSSRVQAAVFASGQARAQ